MFLPHSGSWRKLEEKVPRTTVGASTRLETSSSRSPLEEAGMVPPAAAARA